jgi:RNA polymerase sigma-70 factor, ECF subfamily
MADRGGALDIERLMGEMRPRLHRYCARMMGSAFEGEDVVQDALAKAAAADFGRVEQPRAWLMRIAHNTALDALRARRRSRARGAASAPDDAADPGALADARVAATSGLAYFLALPPTPRASVILADVLGCSLDEITAALGVTPAAAKAALHRGRARLRAAGPGDPPPLAEAERARLRAYADLFNARDFDALRALLAEDVRLDLTNRLRLTGAGPVGLYFTRYAENPGYRAEPCLADGRPALRFSDPAHGAPYVALFEAEDGTIRRIRDFRYAPYAMEGIAVRPL